VSGGPLSLLFNWLGVGNNYPASGNPWGGQPLAVAPAANYFTPNTKLPAENINYEFGLIAGDLGKINTYLEHLAVQNVAFYTTTTSGLIVPGDCNWMGAILWGGGGGGEGGCRGYLQTGGGSTLVAGYTVQGGGGAGAPMVCTFFPTNPGDTLKVQVGSGGAGGAAGGGAGAGGGASLIQCTAGDFSGTTYVEAWGGAGCGYGQENYEGNGPYNICLARAGLYTDQVGICAAGAYGLSDAIPILPFSTGANFIQAGDLARFVPQVPSRGGSVFAYSENFTSLQVASLGGTRGQGNNGSYSGGTPGAFGGNNPTGGNAYWGGTGGGGGGAGPGGNGGAGGSGGYGSGQNGFAGSAPANPVSGAGGGGGGCGGWGSSSPSISVGLGGAGGAGGGGLVYLFQVSGPPTPP
jgi:hypothetical protein